MRKAWLEGSYFREWMLDFEMLSLRNRMRCLVDAVFFCWGILPNSLQWAMYLCSIYILKYVEIQRQTKTVMASNKRRALYMSLTESITLDCIIRQQGEDPPAVQF